MQAAKGAQRVAILLSLKHTKLLMAWAHDVVGHVTNA
jgi:hypothetical protein